MGKKSDKQEQTQEVWGSRRGLSLGALKRGFQGLLLITGHAAHMLNGEFTADKISRGFFSPVK
jgi:hypothetical protein